MYPKPLSWKHHQGFYLLNCALETHTFTIKDVFMIISRAQLGRSEQERLFKAGIEPRRMLLHLLLDLLLLFLEEAAGSE